MTEEQIEIYQQSLGQEAAEALANHNKFIMQDLIKTLEVPKDGRTLVIESFDSVYDGSF